MLISETLYTIGKNMLEKELRTVYETSLNVSNKNARTTSLTYLLCLFKTLTCKKKWSGEIKIVLFNLRSLYTIKIYLIITLSTVGGFEIYKLKC